jgi:organic hydroperoxide reductase OsmC/OhrA
MANQEKRHHYEVQLRWIGNRGAGTSSYQAYLRDFEILGASKPVLPGSSDPGFRGDPKRYNPEEMLVGALSSCHMLWYLHLCAEAGITVVSYEDHPSGTMVETADRGGYFEEVVLQPEILISAASDKSKAEVIHQEAHRLCFLANSINFPVVTKASVRFEPAEVTA